MGRGVVACFRVNRLRAGRSVDVLPVLEPLCAGSGQVLLNFYEGFWRVGGFRILTRRCRLMG